MVAFGSGLMLLPAIKDAVLKEGSNKRYAFMALGPGGLKIIFALLTKIVIFRIRVSVVKVEIPSLKRPVQSIFSRFCLWSWSWYRSGISTVLQVGLHELPK